jgi:glycosyltransferase involved in cell wall biosynthesis
MVAATGRSVASRGRRPKLVVVGGPDVDLRVRLVQELAKHFDIAVLGSESLLEATYQQLGLEYRSYPLRRGINPWADLATMTSLFAQFRSLRPDIVHTYDSKPSALGRIAAHLARVSVIVGTLPGMGSLYVDDRPVTRLRRLPYELTQRLACRLSDITILQNSMDLDDFVARKVVPRSKGIVVASSGVDTLRFCPQRLSTEQSARIRSSLGVEDPSHLVTMVARVIRSKGVLEFAEVARRIRETHPRVRFLLVGPVDHESADSLTPGELAAVQQAVRCTGARSDVSDVLAVTDIFVLPSFYMEGVPRALLEAAACGLAIITTDARGCRDVVENGVSGILIPPRGTKELEAAVALLLDDPAGRAALGSEARRRAVAQFDVVAVADRLRDIYTTLVSR